MDSGPAVGFGFATDDILCSNEDYAHWNGSDGAHSEPVIGTNSAKEFRKGIMTRSSMFPASAHSPPAESSNHDVISTVERSMKTYSDNVMRFLEGISSRMSQLELYCYNIDKSIGEIHSDLVHDNRGADSKLKSLEKHLEEVLRSVQILRDEQDFSETKKELAKLQLSEKEASLASDSENRSVPPPSDPKMTENTLDAHEQQLALALPNQLGPQPLLPTRPVEQLQPVAASLSMAPQSVTKSQAYYFPSSQMPNPPAPTHTPQVLYLHSISQFQTQMHDLSRMAPQPAQTQVTPTPYIQALPQYQQQCSQQLPQHAQPAQQPSMPTQVRSSSAAVYPSYLPSQPPNPSPTETLPSPMPMHSGVPQPGTGQVEAIPYGYAGAGRTVQPPLPQHLKAAPGAHPGEGYAAAGPHPELSLGNAYIMYENQGGSVPHPSQQPHFPQNGYPPASIPNAQPNTASNVMVCPPQLMRNHPYNDLIEKFVNMGYRGDHVVSIIQRLEEGGQTVDFNAVLDRFNGHSSGGSQTGWSR